MWILLYHFHRIYVLIPKALINSYIIHDEFVSVNSALREYHKMTDIKTMETNCVSCKKYATNKSSSVRKINVFYEIVLFVAQLRIKNQFQINFH